MIDSHCHLDVPRFDPDRDAVLERAWAAGLTGLVVPAIGPSDWDALFELPVRDRRIQFGLGIHPQLLAELPPEDDERHLRRLDELLARGGAIAVGECGLDGPTVDRGVPMERQVRILRRHFELADKYGLPVLLHVFRCHPAFRELLREVTPPRAGVLMHSFSGGVDFARAYAKLGFWFSFAGPVTYENARKPLEALKVIPRDRLLLETDAPDQAPHPHRGHRSEPAFLPLICAGMARALEEEPEVLARQTTENAIRLFGEVFGPVSR